MEIRNWFSLPAPRSFRCRFAYIDHEDHPAGVLFDRERVTVRVEREFRNPVGPYRLVVCSVLPWQRDAFLKALSRLPARMERLGLRDYGAFCREYLEDTEDWMARRGMTA